MTQHPHTILPRRPLTFRRIYLPPDANILVCGKAMPAAMLPQPYPLLVTH